VNVTDDGDTTTWLINAAGYVNDDGFGYRTSGKFYQLTYVMMAIAGFIILHSFYLHRWKYNSVRIQTELGAVSAILSGVTSLLALQHPTRKNWALLWDFCYNGIFSLGVQLPDNYMFYYRLLAVVKIPWWHKALIHTFIWLVLICTWFPSQTIIPFFYNENSVYYNYLFNITLAIASWSILAYNFYFTIHFGWILYRVFERAKGNSTSMGPVLVLTSYRITQVIAVKSIGHCITSSFGSLLLSYQPGINNVLYCMVIVVGMHFWFNYTNNRVPLFNEASNADRWDGVSDLSSTQGFTIKKHDNDTSCLSYFWCCFGQLDDIIDNEMPQPVVVPVRRSMTGGGGDGHNTGGVQPPPPRGGVIINGSRVAPEEMFGVGLGDTGYKHAADGDNDGASATGTVGDRVAAPPASVVTGAIDTQAQRPLVMMTPLSLVSKSMAPQSSTR
jgi:hypothetical protein